jgi:hypothetical protein
VGIGMEECGGTRVGFRCSEKRASGCGGSMENGMRCWQLRRGREGPWGRRSPISGTVAILPNCSFLLHHQIRPGFLPPLSSLTGSETPRPAARRPRHAEGNSVRRRGHLLTGLLAILFLCLSFSLAGEWEREEGVGPHCRRARSWLCWQNRGPIDDVALTRFLVVDNVEKGNIDIIHVPTEKQLVDILTKPLDQATFAR